MNSIIQRLLVHLPSGIDQNPMKTQSILISGSGSVYLDNLSLYVTGPSSSVNIDLNGIRISSIPAQLPSGVTATVYNDGPAELLLYEQQYGSLPVTLDVATSPLWYILAVFSRTLESTRRYLYSAVTQINARAAVGMWLDWWSASLGVQRVAGEPDYLFIKRIIGQTLTENVNNTAITELLASIGYANSVLTDSAGSMNINIQFSTAQSFNYTQQQLTSIINIVKSAGVIANVIFQTSLTDSGTWGDTPSYATGGFAVTDSSKTDESTVA